MEQDAVSNQTNTDKVPNDVDEDSGSDEDSNVRTKRKHDVDVPNSNPNPSPRKNKKNKWKHGRDDRIFEYGNYEKYYVSRKPENDNRIYVLKREWFVHKD